MARVSEEFVRQIVFEEIRSLTRKKDMALSESDPVMVDAPLYGDDFGTIFILEVEDRLNVRATTREWSNVHTIGEAIGLLVKLLEEKP